MQDCLVALEDGFGQPLVGLPEVYSYVASVSAMFNCTMIEGRIQNNTVSGSCLERSEASAPPFSPSLPPLAFAPPPRPMQVQ